MSSVNEYTETGVQTYVTAQLAAITPASLGAVSTANQWPIGSAENPQTNYQAARNASIPVNWWCTSQTPTYWAPGDFQIDLS